jgi:hypothetical protein
MARSRTRSFGLARSRNAHFEVLEKRVMLSGVWQQQAKLTASDGAQGDRFGYVAIDGNYAIVGAHRHNSVQGAAYIYERSDSTWHEIAKLEAYDGRPNDAFGIDTAISGEYAVVGTQSHDNEKGAAYVYHSDSEEGWIDCGPHLEAPDGVPGDLFGHSVSISADSDGREWVIAGARHKDSRKGAAYLFYHDTDDVWTPWRPERPLFESDHAPSSREEGNIFGHDVAICGDYAVVGAPHWNIGTYGAAYVYQRSGMNWVCVAKLTQSDPSPGERFGTAVAINSGYVLVSATWDDDNGSRSGSAYLFEKPETGWTDMTETQKLLHHAPSPGDEFGEDVALSDDYAMVGAGQDDTAAGSDAGSATIFRLSDLSSLFLQASDAAVGDRFGTSVSISGACAIIGADLKASWTGAAYMFETSTTTVAVDVKPGSDDNPVNLESRGKLPVAILTTTDFDATTVDTSDLSQIQFGDPDLAGRVSPLRANLDDVDHDGDTDVILHFSMRDIKAEQALNAHSVMAELTATALIDSTPVPIRGTDSVRIVRPKQAESSAKSAMLVDAAFTGTLGTRADMFSDHGDDEQRESAQDWVFYQLGRNI